MRIGTIVRKDVALSRYGKVYMEALKKIHRRDVRIIQNNGEKQWKKGFVCKKKLQKKSGRLNIKLNI